MVILVTKRIRWLLFALGTCGLITGLATVLLHPGKDEADLATWLVATALPLTAIGALFTWLKPADKEQLASATLFNWENFAQYLYICGSLLIVIGAPAAWALIDNKWRYIASAACLVGGAVLLAQTYRLNDCGDIHQLAYLWAILAVLSIPAGVVVHVMEGPGTFVTIAMAIAAYLTFVPWEWMKSARVGSQPPT